MPRLVTAKCPSGHLNGWNVADDARGVATGTCSTCGAALEVALERSEGPIRPTNTPLQREVWATERSRAARAILADLADAAEAYVRLQDLSVEELPASSPLRRALERARVELAKTAP